jgi:hypothetical protein
VWHGKEMKDEETLCQPGLQAIQLDFVPLLNRTAALAGPGRTESSKGIARCRREGLASGLRPGTGALCVR